MNILIFNPERNINAHKILITDLKKNLSNLKINFFEINEEKSLLNELKKNNQINILIHVSDHAKLESNDNWKAACNYCISNNIAPMYMDWGYFNHYKNYIADFYLKNCETSIKNDWAYLSKSINFDQIQENIIEYKNNLIKNVKQAAISQPLEGLISQEYCVIWTQQSLLLLREDFYINGRTISPHEWLINCINQIKKKNLIPVIKIAPYSHKSFKEAIFKLKDECMIFTNDEKDLNEMPFLKFYKEANYKLYAHAKYNIINCSSISNELLLCNRNVIATGKSWFNDLGIFYEPKNWESLLEYKKPNIENQNKWINWWNSKQTTKEKIGEKILDIYNKKYINKNKMNIPKFTKKGFLKAKIPERSWSLIQGVIKDHKHERQPEYSDTNKADLKNWIKSDSHQFATDFLPLNRFPQIEKTVIQEMFQVLSEWSGAELNPKGIIYGIRFYKNNATLKMHTDRQDTHHISVNMSVDLDGEPWLFDIIDHNGERNQIIINPGECVYYESATCLHGRETPFNGNYYANMYCHFTLEQDVLS